MQIKATYSCQFSAAPSEPPQFITGDHVIEVQPSEGSRLVTPKPSEWIQPQKEL